ASVAPDERVAEAIDLVVSKRDDDGRWLLETQYPGKMPVETDEGEGRPSRWNTLRALRVLDWYSARDERPTRVFRCHRVLRHPPQRVFEAFAKPELLARWWGPDGFANTFQEFEGGAVADRIRHIAEPANEQNLNRLQAVLAGEES